MQTFGVGYHIVAQQVKIAKAACFITPLLPFAERQIIKMKKLVSVILLATMLFSVSALASNTTSNHINQRENEDVLQFLADRDGECIEIYVVMRDISYEQVLADFEEAYPEEYCEYEKAKNCDIEILQQNGESLSTLVYDELLQRGIEIKRTICREYYENSNHDIITKYVPEENITFISSYSPMAIVTVNVNDLENLLHADGVSHVEIFEELDNINELVVACQTTTVNYLRDTCGNRGSGVKIGLLEAENGIPDINASDLSMASITCISNNNVVKDHATKVAQILVGNSSGVAPAASLYCRGFVTTTEYYAAVEDLLSQGVNVINYSGGANNEGCYDILSQWTDHIAMQHDVHFVKSAGNNGGVITTPGMGYNVFTVGAYNTAGTVTDADDYLYGYSSYQEIDNGLPRPEKPNLIAPGQNVYLEGWGSSTGTSYAAPMVTGMIADLCSYVSLLKGRQSAMGAILAASSVYKIEGTQGSGVRGDNFITSSQINAQISDKEGAGKLNAKAARHIVTMGQFWSGTKNATDFPFEQTVYIDASSNTLMRTAIFWLKRNSLPEPHNGSSAVTEPFTNLDLYVYDPNGNLLGASTTTYANFEVVQYAPTVSGYYTIRIQYSSGTSSLVSIGIATY